MATKRNLRRGVYTVEASILIPILLFVIATGMRMGIALYQEIGEGTEADKVVEQWSVGDFYKSHWIGEVIHE